MLKKIFSSKNLYRCLMSLNTLLITYCTKEFILDISIKYLIRIDKIRFNVAFIEYWRCCIDK